MNYIGVSLTFISVFIFSSIKNEVSGSTDMEYVIENEKEPLLEEQQSSINENQQSSSIVTDVLVFNADKRKEKSESVSDGVQEQVEDDVTFLDRLSPIRKRIVGTMLSVFSGFMYGVNFMPATYIQDQSTDHSKNGLNYVFAQFCGTYFMSTFYFMIYCIIMKNKPKVYPRVILPGFISGILWSIATICWFIANSELSQAVSFPIVASGPAGIGSLLWGVIVFKEIKGRINILKVVIAFIVMTTGAVVAGLSF